MKEIRYETPTDQIDFTQPTIFLAGPTVRGNQTHLTSWRFEACVILRKKGFIGNVIIPEFVSKTESDKYRYDLPSWEFCGLQNSTVNMFWIPRTRELIGLTTNHEMGYWLARERTKVVYGRPNDAYRMKYLDLMWELDAERRLKDNPLMPIDISIYRTMEETIEASLVKVKNILYVKECVKRLNEARVFI